MADQNLSDRPIIVLISTLASVVVLVAFLTGKHNLPELLTSETADVDQHAESLDPAAAREYPVRSTKREEKVSEIKELDRPRVKTEAADQFANNSKSLETHHEIPSNIDSGSGPSHSKQVLPPKEAPPIEIKGEEFARFFEISDLRFDTYLGPHVGFNIRAKVDSTIGLCFAMFYGPDDKYIDLGVFGISEAKWRAGMTGHAGVFLPKTAPNVKWIEISCMNLKKV